MVPSGFAYQPSKKGATRSPPVGRGDRGREFWRPSSEETSSMAMSWPTTSHRLSKRILPLPGSGLSFFLLTSFPFGDESLVRIVIQMRHCDPGVRHLVRRSTADPHP